MFGGDGDPHRDYFIGGTQIAFTAIEGFRRQLATELAPQSVRVVTLRTGGIPESIPAATRSIESMIAKASPMGRAATLEDVGYAAVFAASDRARTMTAATINISCGTLLD
jgi:NAD(P)-dependent dehydrogenase (short-subunit alcohol dehydrogenase family)